MNKNYYAVIMAGGVGSRFWPVSTPDNPKQFHDMLGTGRSLIQQTFDRLSKLIPAEQILVATNERYKDLVMSHLPSMSENQILLEPAMRNTAPCILYAALKIADQNPDAVMIVAPSDHFIEDEEAFVSYVASAFDSCQKRDILMTLGIKPSGPNTGYGYIQFEATENEVKKVKDFTEKPDLETAKKFLAQGDYLWNAGIFIWSAQSILNSFRISLPAMYGLFQAGMTCWNTGEEVGFIKENYGKAENISIDYGIMEKADNVYVMATEFGWNDLGTWGSLYEKLNKDHEENAIVNAQGFLEDAKRNMISTTLNKKVVVGGISDFIIVETDDTLMIYPKSKEQDIKEVSKAAELRFGKG
ncbi:mannose-1-phosphate guanylyltransferase [Lutimonas saemankumensis]|uniref:mannose-1-phosphate guanylyltransferase n=1 Tax=Lutimonas saemankumensis TaxID=483016 RepID=UPI001CD3EBFD|nr:mannose-1-phosphate guanylyltransferase [Lutimonas saemankumensis]MCA0933854.1 mannose-1-phosphate guanylyltransferase [Lutimonas saemankumensis]